MPRESRSLQVPLIRVGDLRQEKRTESPAPVYSNKAKVKWQKNSDDVVATYNYVSDGVKLKIHYVLEDDNLYVYCDSDEIEEKKHFSGRRKGAYKDRVLP